MAYLGAFRLSRVWGAGVARSYVGSVQWRSLRLPVIAGVCGGPASGARNGVPLRIPVIVGAGHARDRCRVVVPPSS